MAYIVAAAGDEMDDEPRQTPDERPKVFKNMTAWIGGATGVVIALGGLATAYQQLMSNKPVRAAATNGEAAPTAASADDNAAAPAVEADEPWYYTTDDGGTL